MIQNREGWLILQMAVQPFSKTQSGWTVGISTIWSWTERNLNKGKCSFLHLQQKTWESWHTRRSQQCVLVAKKANSMLGHIRKNSASRSLPAPLLSPGVAVCGALCQLLSSPVKKSQLLEWVQRATKIIKGVEHLSYEQWLRGVALIR